MAHWPIPYRLKLGAFTLFARIMRGVGLATYPYKPYYDYYPNIYHLQYWKSAEHPELRRLAALAQEVREAGRTYLNYDRLYTLYQAVLNALRLAPAPPAMAEVGVFRGGATYFIAAVAGSVAGQKPAIHGFDTFEGHAAADITEALDGAHQAGEFAQTSYEEVRDYLAKFENVTIHKGRFQDTCDRVASEQFGFVHLDVDVYKATRDALDFFAERLLVGGIIVVDDYGKNTCRGATQAVDEFVEAHSNFIRFHFLTAQCLLIRRR